VVLRRISAAAEERRRVAERDKLLMAELDHRVKNTIANIQALVLRTSRSADSLTGFVEGLDGRIKSMAKSHSLLSQSRWEGVSIDRLLREELDPYTSGRSSAVLGGVEIVLTPKSALSLSLAIHELATNAAKFGAFSKKDGTVSVSWRMTAEGGVDLSWREVGGPTVRPPARRGFGSTLIERALAMETGGRANLQYLEAGVVCDIHLPSTSILRYEAAGGSPEFGGSVANIASAVVALHPYRVLVVEDSFLLVMAIQDLFDDLGWQLIGPGTRLDDALELVRTQTFDAALLDVNLDGAMSWEVADQLEKRGIPFVFSTGYDVTSVLPPQFSGSTIIAKPFNLQAVEAALRLAIVQHGAAKLDVPALLP